MSKYREHPIFRGGLHRKANPAEAIWPNARVEKVFENSIKYSPDKIDYVFRHEGYPVFGHALKSSLHKYEKDGFVHIGMTPAVMADSFIDGLKGIGMDQLSVELGLNGEILRVGITDDAAVAGMTFEASKTTDAEAAETVVFSASDLDGGLAVAFESSWRWPLQHAFLALKNRLTKDREKKIETDGIDAADKENPQWEIDALDVQLPDEPVQPDVALSTFESDDMTEAQRKEFERLQKFEQDQLKKAADDLEASRKQAVTQFCTDHAEIVTDKVKPQIVALLTALQQVEAPATFEADGKPVEKSAFELGCDLIASWPKAVSFERDVAGHGKGPGPEKDERTPEQKAADYNTERLGLKK